MLNLLLPNSSAVPAAQPAKSGWAWHSKRCTVVLFYIIAHSWRSVISIYTHMPQRSIHEGSRTRTIYAEGKVSALLRS